jgi:hypothetical protein
MDKKALRKELELALSKSIIEILDKRNPLAGKQIQKKIEEVSKTLAKKFYKTVKDLSVKKTVPAKALKKKIVPVKKTPVKKTRSTTVKRTKK